jgi:hypothetical protein
MDLNKILDDLRRVATDLAAATLAGLAVVEVWLRAQLAALGLGPQLQTVIIIVIALALLFPAIRLISGVARLILVALLIVILAQIVVPMLRL